MTPELEEIILRSPDIIQQEIDALEREISDDLAPGKATYKFNTVLHKIASLNRDVQTLAIGIAEVLERQDTHGKMLAMLCELRQAEKK